MRPPSSDSEPVLGTDQPPVFVVPRWLGAVWMTAGVVAIVGALVGALVGMAFISGATAASIEALRLTQSVFEGVDETGAVLDQAFTDVAAGLDTVQRSVVDASSTLDRMSGITDDLTVLLTEDVPGSLDAVHDTMPQLIRTAGVLDTTMRALRFVGADYDPEAPLDDSLIELDQKLVVIPKELRAQRQGLEDVSDRIGDFARQSRTIGNDVGLMRDSLVRSRRLIDRYRSTAEEASVLTGGLAAELRSQASTARWVIIVVALAVIAGQSVPLVFGWAVFRPAGRSSLPSRPLPPSRSIEG